MAIITLLGAPWDGSSSYQRGPAAAPPLIRQALWNLSSNTISERGDDLADPTIFNDAGDLVLGDNAAAARAAIERRVREVLANAARPLVLGGDHSVTYPVLRGFPSPLDGLTIVHLDAHADLYDEFPPLSAADEGATLPADRYSHACPFARILEERQRTRLVQVGIRALTPHLRAQASRFGVEVFPASRWQAALPVISRLTGPVYISLDLDVLEPMLAPGLSHPEPGGLTVREVLDVLDAVQAPVVGADVVEYNPLNDLRDLTARVAAKFVKELVGVMRR